MHFLGKTLLVFALLHSVFQGQICLLLQVFLEADISSWFMEAIEYIGRLALAGALGSGMGRWVQGWQRQESREEGTTWSWSVEGGT